MNALDDKISLVPGDRISFRVIEDRDDAVPRIVTDTGEVDFPYVGRLKVAGMTCLQVALQLKRLLEVDYYKTATVIVGIDVIPPPQDIAHDVVWIVGQVRQVGPQEILKEHPLTVSQIILRAGGFGDFADERKVRLIHQTVPSAPSPAGESTDTDAPQGGQTVDVKSVFEGHSTLDPIVRPNDLIFVPKRLVNL
jgi:protein involved in polysaccharide export with SLBB domain